MTALPILPSAALSSVSGGTTPLPSSALQTDKIFSTDSLISDRMAHWHKAGAECKLLEQQIYDPVEIHECFLAAATFFQRVIGVDTVDTCL